MSEKNENEWTIFLLIIKQRIKTKYEAESACFRYIWLKLTFGMSAQNVVSKIAQLSSFMIVNMFFHSEKFFSVKRKLTVFYAD